MNKKMFLGFILALSFLFSSLAPAFAATGPDYVRYTRSQAIERYNKYMSSYLAHDQKIVDQFRARKDGTLAHKLVERAVWYMENGYMVYGHEYKGYKDYGIVDCSNFVSLVFADMGFEITTTARKYNTVGQKVEGVYSTVVGKTSSGRKLYGLKGLENLRPGDVLTWYKVDSSGQKYISHVAIYMGMFDGKPAVIGTTGSRPTAIGITTDFRYWWGENFYGARRILPEKAWDPAATSQFTIKAPVIPKSYVLPPQKPVRMPSST